MTYSLGGAFQRNKGIAYGCLLLLSSVTTAGAVRLETNSSTFSKWAQSVGGLFTNTSSSSPAPQAQDVIGPFLKQAGEGIKKAATDYVWTFLKGSFEVFTSLGSTYKDWFSSVKNFFSSSINTDMIHMFFRNIHLKLWRTLSFAVTGEKKSQFIGLFKSDKWQNTLLASKFLLGLPLGSSNIKAHPSVFSYLLMKWMENPDKVTTKIENLINTIKELNETHGNGGSSGRSSGGASGNNFYELSVQTLDEYLNIDVQWRENLWKYALLAEIYTKTKTGLGTLGGIRSMIANPWGALAFNWFS